MSNNRYEHLRGAIASAENSIRLAKQLLADLENGRPEKPSQPHAVSQVPDKPGVVGVYDGEKMTSSDGQTFMIPGNYASKSLLVVGDTLKMYEENGEKRFKQIEHVKRHKTTGLLVKKDGKFRAITPEGSYKVLTESINHFNGEVGDEVVLHLPAGNLTSPYAAIETIHKKNKAETPAPEVAAQVSEKAVVEESKSEPKPTPKAKKEAPKHSKPAEKKAAPKAVEPISKPDTQPDPAPQVQEAVVETPPATPDPVANSEEELS